MKCKFCDAELEEGVTLCPVCGADNGEAEAVQAELNPQEAEEILREQETEEIPLEQETKNKPGMKLWMKILAIVGAVALLAGLALLLLSAFGVSLKPRENDIFYKESYAVSDKKAAKQADDVVATLNGRELTNGALQVYVKMQILDFTNEYASYMSYLELDTSKPLCDQKCYFDANMNWEQYFVDTAIEAWANYQCIYAQSVEDGFAPSGELLSSLEQLPADIEEMAKEEEFESADAFIQDRFGAATTLEDYIAYCKLMYSVNEYLSTTPTDEEVENFYTENEDYFIENEIDKSVGPMVSVRHILLEPQEITEETTEESEETTEPVEETEAAEETEATEAAETTEATEATAAAEETVAPEVTEPSTEETEPVTEETESGYSEEAWAECLQRAEALLAQWKEGEATEESFANLANEHSVDGGSNTNGGLYSGITATTSFVPEFLAWCMDESRQVGDTGIVKTEYGYHIMYFSDSEPLWKYYATQYFLSDRADKKIQSGKEKWEVEINYKKIALPALELQ